MSENENDQAKRRGVRKLEHQVSELLTLRVARNVLAPGEKRLSFGERAADTLAEVAGSWRFIYSFGGFLAVWIVINSIAAIRHWDPYPFILLNLMLSCLAAIQAPVIMMSQNRQEARDRLRAESDYQVDVKAEILLEHLTHEIGEVKRMLAGLGAPTQPELPAPGKDEAVAGESSGPELPGRRERA
ncbi:MAG: DUF1003 domain-containing protein [Thermoleophilia bacterium]|nr:DUF1003 domain-containing protein [Thermoleophilia bacterium]